MFAETMASLFKFERKAPEVREGSVFCHRGPGNRVETAEVVHVGPDSVTPPAARATPCRRTEWPLQPFAPDGKIYV